VGRRGGGLVQSFAKKVITQLQFCVVDLDAIGVTGRAGGDESSWLHRGLVRLKEWCCYLKLLATRLWLFVLFDISMRATGEAPHSKRQGQHGLE
jgi:hypothetical protein